MDRKSLPCHRKRQDYGYTFQKFELILFIVFVMSGLRSISKAFLMAFINQTIREEIQ